MHESVLHCISHGEDRIQPHELVAEELQVLPTSTEVCIGENSSVKVKTLVFLVSGQIRSCALKTYPEPHAGKSQDGQVELEDKSPLGRPIVRMEPFEDAALVGEINDVGLRSLLRHLRGGNTRGINRCLGTFGRRNLVRHLSKTVRSRCWRVSSCLFSQRLNQPSLY